jgi:hypothetical protein
MTAAPAVLVAWTCECGGRRTVVRCRPTWGTATEWPKVVCADCGRELSEEE